MDARAERIEALAPRQALDIVQNMTSWLDGRQAEPQELAPGQEAEALNALFQEAGYAPLPLDGAAKPDEQAAGQATRQMLHLLAESDEPDVLEELDQWLAEPPGASNLAIAEAVVLPIVYTACIVILTTSFDFRIGKDKRVRRTGLAGKQLSGVLAPFYGILKQLAGRRP
jgi:hypothetical protein